MWDKQKKETQGPEAILQAAIEELEVFTQSEASRFEMGKDGRLVATKESRLNRIVGLARSYIEPFFSEQLRQKQEKKLDEIKKAILHARDMVQTHSALIEKFKEGDDTQRKLAASALSAIQRYNAIVVQGNLSENNQKIDVYNYERNRLLLDREIQGRQIELPHAVSVKYNSHPDAHPAHKMLKQLSQTLLFGAAKKTNSEISSTHKKSIQFMIDTFHMKAIRLIQSHLSQQNSMTEILQLVKKTSLEIDEEGFADLITMRQLLEIGPGSYILVTGCFKRNPANTQFLTMPILDSFRLSFQLTHSGFPYPSQHTSWALADKWVEAYPLRADQVPLFQEIDQKKKCLNQKLLFDQSFIQKVRQYAKLKREVFDQHRDLFLPLHRQLQEVLNSNVLNEGKDDRIDQAFYSELLEAPSAFDILVQSQQRLLDLFVNQPIKALEEEWLGSGSTPLRIGSSQEKFQAACHKLEQLRQKAQECLDPHDCRHAYILKQGLLIGKAFQAVGLQYQSEKMGFFPPLLNDFERKLQACAFQQLLTFIDECENRLDNLDADQIKEDLLAAWTKDLQLLSASSLEESDFHMINLIDQLEVYFNSRFYAIQRGQET